MANRTTLSMAPYQGNTGNFQFSIPLVSLDIDGVPLTNGTINVRSMGASKRVQVVETITYNLFDFKVDTGELVAKKLTMVFPSEAAANDYIAEQNNWQTSSVSGATIAPPLGASGALIKLVYTTQAV